MAPASPAPAAEEDATTSPAAAAASASGGRRRGWRSLSWGTVFCFTSRREGCLQDQDQDQEALAAAGTPWRQRSRRRKRTVPVDGDLVATTADPEATTRRGGGADDEESRKGHRVHGCCLFWPPARTPRHQQVQHHEQNCASLSPQHGTVDDSGAADSKHQYVELTEQPPRAAARSGSETSSPSETRAPSRAHRVKQPHAAAPAETRAPTPTAKARGGRARSSNSEASAREPCTKRAGAGTFGPVVGLSVVAAVSMAGLLGGRVWAVACVCAWLAALSRLRWRNAPAGGYGTARSDGGQEVAVDVDSTDYKKLVVLRGLLERDRTKAVM